MKNNYIRQYDNLSEPLKASVWYTFARVIQKGTAFLTIPIFTRLMTTNEYGEVNLFLSWLSIISIFATLNLSAGVFNKGMVKFDNDKAAFVSSIQGLSTAVTSIILVFYLCFMSEINQLLNMSSIVILAMFIQLLFSPAIEFWSSKLRFEFKYKKVIFVTISISILTTAVGIIAVMIFKDKSTSKILSGVLILAAFGSFIYVKNYFRGKKFYDKKYWKYALTFNLPLIPHYLSGIILSQSDRLMIDYFIGTDKVAIYSVAYSLAMLFTIINTSINQSFVPWSYKKMKEKKYTAIMEVSNILIVFIASIVLLLIAIAPELMLIVTPLEYYEAIWVLPPVVLSVYFMFLYNIFVNIELYFEKKKYILIASLTGSILNIVLNIYFIPRCGYIAAAYTTLACYIIYSLFHYYFMKKTLKSEQLISNVYNMKCILIISLLLIILTFILSILYANIYIRYSMVIAAILCIIIKRNLILDYLKQLKLGADENDE